MLFIGLLAIPLVVKAIERPVEPVPFQNDQDTVLDPSRIAWEQITANPEVVQFLIEQTFDDAPVMVSIARAESRFDCKARNPNSTAKGCFQILDGTWRAYKCVGNVMNAMDNIACARKIYDAEGTRPWASSGPW